MAARRHIFAGPGAVLAYLSRYTHRVAIANSRLLALDERGVSFRWKDYRDKGDPDKPSHKSMTLAPDEFMRRFLLHVLPGGFHRIRHFGLIANNARKEKLAVVRELLGVAASVPTNEVQAVDAVDAVDGTKIGIQQPLSKRVHVDTAGFVTGYRDASSSVVQRNESQQMGVGRLAGSAAWKWRVYQPDQFKGYMQLWSIDDDKTFGPTDPVDALAACFGQSGGQVERLHLHPRAVGRKAIGHSGVFQRVAEAEIWPLVMKHIEAKVPRLRPIVGGTA